MDYVKFFKDKNIEINLKECYITNNICMAINQIEEAFKYIKIQNYLTIIKTGKINENARIEGKILTIKEGITYEQIQNNRTIKNGLEIFKNNEDLPKDLLTNKNYLLSPKNTNNATGLIIHELGHTLSTYKNSFYSDFVKFVNKATKTKDYMYEKGYKELCLNALLGDSEFFADAFSDYIVNKNNASVAGKLIPKFLKEQGIIE